MSRKDGIWGWTEEEIDEEVEEIENVTHWQEIEPPKES